MAVKKRSVVPEERALYVAVVVYSVLPIKLELVDVNATATVAACEL